VTDPVVVVGGSVAALTAADALASVGTPVELFLPERGIGGGFLPLERDGRRLDLGPRVIELRYDDAAPDAPLPPWSEYVPGPHGHRPFLAAVEAFVEGLAGADLVAVPSPQSSVLGRRTTDYALAGDLSGVADALPSDLLATMAEEAAAARAAVGDHGWFAAERGGLPWDRSYGEIGRAHCGSTFFDVLVGSVAAKIVPGGADEVLAPLHRKIWLPLFHPVTAWEAVTGSLTYVPNRPFATVAGGGMGELVRRLHDRAVASPMVTVRREGSLTEVTSHRGRAELRFATSAVVPAARPILGVSADELFAAAGIDHSVAKVQATMVWVDLPQQDVASLPSVLYSAEPELGVFRVTDSVADIVPGRRTVCCEIACHVPSHEREATALEALVALGVAASVERASVVASVSVPAFAAPTGPNRAAFDAARAAFDRHHLPVHLVAGPTAFGVDTFNEQVVQGLAAAAQHAT
jgi:hypothetical protein